MIIFEYAKNRTFAAEPTDIRNVINGVSGIIHIHDIFVAFRLGHCFRRFCGYLDIFLEQHDMAG